MLRKKAERYHTLNHKLAVMRSRVRAPYAPPMKSEWTSSIPFLFCRKGYGARDGRRPSPVPGKPKGCDGPANVQESAFLRNVRPDALLGVHLNEHSSHMNAGPSKSTGHQRIIWQNDVILPVHVLFSHLICTLGNDQSANQR